MNEPYLADIVVVHIELIAPMVILLLSTRGCCCVGKVFCHFICLSSWLCLSSEHKPDAN